MIALVRSLFNLLKYLVHYLLPVIFSSNPIPSSCRCWVDRTTFVLFYNLSCYLIHFSLVYFVVRVHRLDHVRVDQFKVFQHIHRIINGWIHLILTLPLHFELIQVTNRMFLESVTRINERKKTLFIMIMCHLFFRVWTMIDQLSFIEQRFFQWNIEGRVQWLIGIEINRIFIRCISNPFVFGKQR